MTRFGAAWFLCLALTLVPMSAPAGEPPDCCGEPLNYHFSSSRVSDQFLPNANSPQTTADFPEMGPNCLGDQLMIEVGVPQVGLVGTSDVYLNVISEDLDRLFPDPKDADNLGHGIQGWSVGVVIEDLAFDGPGFNLDDTAADLNPFWGGTGFAGGSGPGGLKPFPSLFFSFAIIDPLANGGVEGCTIAFAHCLDGCDATEFGELPLEGTESLVRITVATPQGVTEAGHVGALRIQDKLQIDSVTIPTDTILTIVGDARRACNEEDVRANLSFVIREVVDCNGNEIDDADDIAMGTSQDCNNNMIPDECDIASGTSQDCNNNGVPDECDIASGASQDCNNNGTPDECDIASGTSQDCNNNGTPDECDIASGTSQDCNNNMVPDECDLALGTSQDCNDNGILDDCDIANGTSEDVDMNGVPDECGGGQIPGDFNQDGGFNIADPVRLLNILFVPGAPDLPCEPVNVFAPGNLVALDFNGDETVNIADPVAALNRLFGQGDPHVLGVETDCVIVPGCEDVCPP